MPAEIVVIIGVASITIGPMNAEADTCNGPLSVSNCVSYIAWLSIGCDPTFVAVSNPADVLTIISITSYSGPTTILMISLSVSYVTSNIFNTG